MFTILTKHSIEYTEVAGSYTDIHFGVDSAGLLQVMGTEVKSNVLTAIPQTEDLMHTIAV